MSTDSDILKLLVSKLERIEDKADANGEKLDKLALWQARCEVICDHREKENKDITARLSKMGSAVESLSKAVGNIQQRHNRSDWKIFASMLLKGAIFITTIGGAGAVIYRIVVLFYTAGVR